jgi:hypothetical protein
VKLTPAGKLGAPSTGKGKGRALDDNDEDLFTKDPAKGSVIKSSGSFINVLHTFKNIAPIMDAALADIDGSGEVCSIADYHTTSHCIDDHLAPGRHLLWRWEHRIGKYRPKWGRFYRIGINTWIN